MASASFFMGYSVYTGRGAPVPASEYYDSFAMTLFAYAVRRTIGAAIVFLLVVMLTMFTSLNRPAEAGAHIRLRISQSPEPCNGWEQTGSRFRLSPSELSAS
jgi:hypothetical protein